jgi:hypothetical protein
MSPESSLASPTPVALCGAFTSQDHTVESHLRPAKTVALASLALIIAKEKKERPPRGGHSATADFGA